MKILFCTDGSKTSFSALENIASWLNNGIIDVICVIDWNFLPEGINIEEFDFINSCPDGADNILNFAEEEIKRLNFTLGKKIKSCGSAIENILDITKENNYDLILMGSHGKRGLQKWLGSVSQEVINSGNTPVYIAKGKTSTKKILFTTDGTSCAINILKEILPSLDLHNKEIYICMVNDDPNYLFLENTLDSNWLLQIQRQQQIYAAKALKEIQTILNEHNSKPVQTSILTGIPALKIIEYVKENQIDLIILGSRNKSKLDRFLTGSVSKRILENVNNDVWIARCKSIT